MFISRRSQIELGFDFLNVYLTVFLHRSARMTDAAATVMRKRNFAVNKSIVLPKTLTRQIGTYTSYIQESEKKKK